MVANGCISKSKGRARGAGNTSNSMEFHGIVVVVVRKVQNGKHVFLKEYRMFRVFQCLVNGNIEFSLEEYCMFRVFSKRAVAGESEKTGGITPFLATLRASLRVRHPRMENPQSLQLLVAVDTFAPLGGANRSTANKSQKSEEIATLGWRTLGLALRAGRKRRIPSNLLFFHLHALF